jgi:hypothetical protein
MFDTVIPNTSSRSRDALRPRFASNVRPSKERAQGMPDARCTRDLVCNVHKKMRTRAYRAAEAIRHSLRNGFTAYIALSPATNSSCHRRRRIIGSSQTRLGYENLRRLDTSNGCQDHTVLPYAATSFVCTLLLAHRQSLPCDHLARATLPRPPQPVPTFVTMANAPLRNGMAIDVK